MDTLTAPRKAALREASKRSSHAADELTRILLGGQLDDERLEHIAMELDYARSAIVSAMDNSTEMD